jgi:hypothetical protein
VAKTSLGKGSGRVIRAEPSQTARGDSDQDVVLVQWPEEPARLDRLRREGRPRLVLVSGGEEAPLCSDCEEDWIRLPATEVDVTTRVFALAARAARHVSMPKIDTAGRLHFRGRWMPMSTLEEPLMRTLIESFGSVVPADELTRASWPGEADRNSVLRVRLVHLRKRLGPLGLKILSVRSRGYVLEAEQSPDATTET